MALDADHGREQSAGAQLSDACPQHGHSRGPGRSAFAQSEQSGKKGPSESGRSQPEQRKRSGVRNGVSRRMCRSLCNGGTLFLWQMERAPFELRIIGPIG